jgi:hypothetical protein
MPGLRPFSFSVDERKIMNHFVGQDALEACSSRTVKQDGSRRFVNVLGEISSGTVGQMADGRKKRDRESFQRGGAVRWMVVRFEFLIFCCLPAPVL